MASGLHATGSYHHHQIQRSKFIKNWVSVYFCEVKCIFWCHLYSKYKNTHKKRNLWLWLPFFITDKNLVEIWGVFIQDGVPHVQQQAPVNLNQVLHKKERKKKPRWWTHPLITLLFLGRASRRTYWNVDEDAIDFCSRDEFLQRIQETLKRREKCQEQKWFHARTATDGF